VCVKAERDLSIQIEQDSGHDALTLPELASITETAFGRIG
jgi:hypothetical protein